ncbi:hypothetical protein ACLOJK_021310 [Asimina triloba]
MPATTRRPRPWQLPHAPRVRRITPSATATIRLHLPTTHRTTPPASTVRLLIPPPITRPNGPHRLTHPSPSAGTIPQQHGPPRPTISDNNTHPSQIQAARQPIPQSICDPAHQPRLKVKIQPASSPFQRDDEQPSHCSLKKINNGRQATL